MRNANARVSVIIPSHQRSHVVGRAIGSAQRQSLQPAEIFVVDDGSTDGTRVAVEAVARDDSRVRLIRFDDRHGAPAARNAGIRAATGQWLAFLDSDDEWRPGHLARKVALLDSTGAKLAFGSFVRDDARTTFVQRCPPYRPPALEYLFLTTGDFRTSTIVCDRHRALEVLFDESLPKHQDWDFLINFQRSFAVTADPEATVIAHTGGTDRISLKSNHGAAEQFFLKNRLLASANEWALFASVMAARAFREERRGRHFERFMRLIQEVDPAAIAPVRRLLPLLHVPRVGYRLFRWACRQHFGAMSRRRAAA